MGEKPLRLIIFAFLYLINLILSLPNIQRAIIERIELLPPEAVFWVNMTIAAFILALLMLLIITVWLENPITYILSIIFISSEIAEFFIRYPEYPLFLFILEVIQLALLLSLIKHFFKR